MIWFRLRTERYILEDNLRIPSGASYPLIAREELDKRKTLITEQSRRFIAQEEIDFIDLPIIDENGNQTMHKADLRAFVLSGKTTKVWCSGLTRFSRDVSSFVVNSSQGGGFIDTWVLSQE